MRRYLLAAILTLFVGAPTARALDVGSDGSDGALNITQNTVIHLENAAIGSWTDPGNGNGVYDPVLWAIVFKYSSVNINSSRTVTFTNHYSDAPVVWLVQGNVTVNGFIDMRGSGCLLGGNFSIPGPGGFRGGKGWQSVLSPGAAGLGPGGGGYTPNTPYYASGGSYGTAGEGPDPGPVYGNARILPLIGGSGGGGSSTSEYSGGAGGGAMLIASNGTIHCGGSIYCNGGTGNCGYAASGSGGGIRLIANAVTGNAGGLQAIPGPKYGYSGGYGRIRIEANVIDMTGTSNPEYSSLVPLENDTAVIWPPSGSPSLQVTHIAGQPVTDDPHSEFSPPGDVQLSVDTPVNVDLEATNMPLDWLVRVRVALKAGDEYSVNATYVDGDSVSSRWTASLQALPSPDFVAIQARASKP